MQQAFGDKRAPNVRERRTDELHDFNFVTARQRGQPDHVRHRHRTGKGHEHDDYQADPTDETDGGVETRDPGPVESHIGDAGHRGQDADHVVDRRRRGLGTRIQPDRVGRRKRVALETGGREGQIREVLGELAPGGVLGKKLHGCREPALVQDLARAGHLLLRDVVAQIDGELCGLAPAADHALQIRVDHQEEPEDEQTCRDRQHRERGGAPAAPQALACFAKKISKGTHQATSTTLP